MSLSTSEEIMATPVGLPPRAKLTSRDRDAAPRVEIVQDPSRVMPIWQDLLAVAPASVYQTPGFLLPWIATLGDAAGITPLFILQRDDAGLPLALLALGLKSLGPFRIAVFLGGKDSNCNMGLFRPGYEPDRAAILALLRDAAKACGAKQPDLFLLMNQPLEWDGRRNPLALLPRQDSPSFAYKAAMGHDAESFFAEKLSKDSRKKLRKKEKRLAEIGPVQHVADSDDASLRERVIEAFFTQKLARFEEKNITSDFGSFAMRAFVETASQHAANSFAGRLELHALLCGDRIVATYGGATYQGHFSAFFNSFDSDPEMAKSSPGDLLLLKLITAKCAQGVTSLDLGIGEARYKEMVCDETVPLFDCFVPVSFKGQALVGLLALAQRMKRLLKQNKRVFELARRAKTALHRKT